MPVRELTPKQAKFVEYWVVCHNAEKAATEAGFSDPAYGRQLITFPNVKKAIKEAELRLTVRVEVDANKVIQEVCCIAFSDPKDMVDKKGNLLPLHKIPERTRRAISSVSLTNRGIKYSLWSKNDALEKLLNYLGAYPDAKPDPKKVAVDGSGQRNLTDEERTEAVRRFLSYDRRVVDGEGAVVDSGEPSVVHGETGNPDGADDGGPVASGPAPQPL